MANKYNINGVPPQNKIVNSLDNANLLASRFNIPLYVASTSLDAVSNNVKQAGTLEDAAQSVNAPIEQFNNISSAMRIKGADKEQSIQSTQELYSKLNSLAMETNESYSVLSGLLNSYGTDIAYNENSTIDVPNTMLNISRIFPVMGLQDKNTLINTVEFNKNSVTLLREGEELGNLLSQAKHLGHSSSPELHERKTRLNDALNKFNFLTDSWIDKQKDKLSDLVTTGDFLADFIGGFSDSYGFDREETTVVEYYAAQNGYDMSWYKTVIDDPEFTQQLDKTEKESLLSRLPLQSLDTKYRKYKQIKEDVAAINNMSTTGEVPNFIPPNSDFNLVTDILYSGVETENDWSNNRITDLNAPEPYSLLPSHSIYPDSNIVAPPASISPIYAEQMSDFNFTAIADVIATAMQNNRVQIELTLIDGRTGETSVVLGQGGGRITYAMAMPM
ncbi:TPA: chemotaxis protein [Yersinia enterocolitica]